MNDLLDQALANTTPSPRSGGPQIVSEQHDLSKIKTDGMGGGGGKPSDGLKRQIDQLRGSGGWDAAEYGISREAQIAKLEEGYQKALAYEKTPEGIKKAQEEAERVLVEMRQRAVRRAGLDTSNGRVAVVTVGKEAWHGLGVNVAEALNSADAMRLSGTGWRVTKRPLSFRKSDGSYIESDEVFAIVRDDTEAQLGTVGSRYVPIQNEASFGLLDHVMEEFGAKYHTAGSIYDGKSVWLQVELPNSSFEVTRGDEVNSFGMFTNPHDGSGKAWAFPTTVRAVCANTFRTASEDRKKGLGIRHTGDIKAKVNEVRRVLGIAVKEIDTFKENADVLLRTKVTPLPYFEGLLDACLEVTKADMLKGADALAAAVAISEADQIIKKAHYERQIEKRKNLLNEVLSQYDSPANGLNGMRGTGWAAFQAVTASTSHGMLGGKFKGKDKESKRFESLLTGDGNEVNQLAYEQVLALAN